MDANQLAATIEAGQHIFASKCWWLGACSIVFFDHFIMFGDEVKYIWSRKFTLVTFLYLFARYYSFISIIVNIVLLFDTSIDPETCKRAGFVQSALATIPVLACANTLLALRVRALYNQATIIPLFLGGMIITQIAVGMWISLRPGGTVIVPPPISSSLYKECFNLPNPAINKPTVYLFLGTAFDSVVLLLTTYKTYFEGFSPRSRLRVVLARDGVFYYGVIFATCLTWAVMEIRAPPDLQYINALPTDCLTVIMVCRITLNLREAGNSRLGWGNEPTFSLSTIRFGQMARWTRPANPNHTQNDSEGQLEEIPLSSSSGMPGPGGDVESVLVHANTKRIHMDPPPHHTEPGSYEDDDLRSHPPPDLALEQQRPNGLNTTFLNRDPNLSLGSLRATPTDPVSRKESESNAVKDRTIVDSYS